MMKAYRIGLMILMTVLVSLVWSEAEADGDDVIRPGDSMERVLRVMGEPRGKMETEKSAWLYFTRGEVRLENGVVTAVSLISEEELQTREARRAQEREQRIAEGEALRQRALEDTRFADRSATEQVAFWRRFRDRYPEVDVDRIYLQALKEAETEAERLRTQQRIAALERRVADAETQARRAESQALQAQWSRPVQPVFTAPVVYWGPRTHAPSSGTVYHQTRGQGTTISGGGTVRLGSEGGVNFRFDRRGDTMFTRQHISPGLRDTQFQPQPPAQAQPAGHTGRGYIHGRSHGLGTDNSSFRW